MNVSPSLLNSNEEPTGKDLRKKHTDREESKCEGPEVRVNMCLKKRNKV